MSGLALYAVLLTSTSSPRYVRRNAALTFPGMLSDGTKKLLEDGMVGTRRYLVRSLLDHDLRLQTRSIGQRLSNCR